MQVVSEKIIKTPCAERESEPRREEKRVVAFWRVLIVYVNRTLRGQNPMSGDEEEKEGQRYLKQEENQKFYAGDSKMFKSVRGGFRLTKRE